MFLRQLNIAPRAALGFALIAVLVALLGVFALGQMSSIRESEVAVEKQWLPSIRGGDEIREIMLRIRTISLRMALDQDPKNIAHLPRPDGHPRQGAEREDRGLRQAGQHRRRQGVV